MKGMSDKPWLARLRLRVLAVAAGAGLLAWGMIALASFWAVPVVAVTLAGVTFVVNLMTSRLNTSTCLDCGGGLADAAHDQYGVVCPACGAICLHNEVVASLPDTSEDDEASEA